MKKTASIILSLLLAVTLSAQSADTARFAALGLKLAEYYDAMERESLSVQQQECDFLIETATDPVLRQYIAQNIYEHYSASPVMGAENVAVHVFDKWFAGEGLPMASPEAYAQARTYADFNRQSLLGCQAPALEMETPDGSVVKIFARKPQNGITQDDIAQNGVYGEVLDGSGDDRTEVFKILFFYDADCSKCKLQVRLLNALFNKKSYPVDVYAVYVGDDKAEWAEYMSGQFDFPDKVDIPSGAREHGKYSDASICHLWDPTLASDFQRKYGVAQTPRIFLIAPDGTIIGRGLDAVALEAMLDGLFTPKEMVYGGRESEELFDGIFAAYGGKPQIGAVKGIADYVHDKTLSAGDALMFKQLAGDFLYYLSTRTGEGFKEGMRYHIDKNILSQDKVWTSHDDSLKVVGFARIMSDLLSKALPGSRIASLKVPGELYTAQHSGDVSGGSNVNDAFKKSDKPKIVRRKLDRLNADENIIIFYTEGCEVCKAEKTAAMEYLSSDASHKAGGHMTTHGADVSCRSVVPGKINVFMVNVDAIMASDPSLASRLMDTFDLSSLPYIICTDRRGTILGRYLSLDF